MVPRSPTPSFPGAWPDSSETNLVSPIPDLSPSLISLSPPPDPELPSLSSSLSTAQSSDTSRSLTPPEQSTSLVEDKPTYVPLQTDSPVVLDLREPRSPDSAHFSPTDDASSLSSPSSYRIQISVSNHCQGTQSLESVATHIPSLSKLPTERGGCQDEETHPDPLVEEATNQGSNVDRQEHYPAAANVSVNKRTFLNRVKRFGGRVRKLLKDFKPRVIEIRPRRSSVSSPMSPGEPPLTVQVLLPIAEPESPRSRQDPEARSTLPRRFSLPARLPTGSTNSGLRNRLSMIVSAPDDWLSPLNMHSSGDAAAADVPRSAADESTRATSAVRHSLGIQATEPVSVTNRDTF